MIVIGNKYEQVQIKKIMKLNTLGLKITLGITYLTLIFLGLYFLFSAVDIKDLMSYEFIRLNKDVILKYKNENFIFLTVMFFTFSVVWVLLLGFAMPLLIFAGSIVILTSLPECKPMPFNEISEDNVCCFLDKLLLAII